MVAFGEHRISDPVGVADAFCKRYPQAISGIEKVRLMKGREIPDWPYWCFLPESHWIMLFLGKQRSQFTREMWREIQKLHVLGTWRYSKGIYPVRSKPVKTKKGFRLFPATGPRCWTVGENTGEMLVAAFDGTEICAVTGRQVRAHLRRGHWHGFWSGKSDGSEDRKFSYRWLPPQIIGGRRIEGVNY